MDAARTAVVALAAAAALAAAPAGASTLLLYDWSDPFGSGAGEAGAPEAARRAIASGLIRPTPIRVDDGGAETTETATVEAAAIADVHAPGGVLRRTATTWTVRTRSDANGLAWSIAIARAVDLPEGAPRPAAAEAGEAAMSGTSGPADDVAVETGYRAGGRLHLILGYLVPDGP